MVTLYKMVSGVKKTLGLFRSQYKHMMTLGLILVPPDVTTFNYENRVSCIRCMSAGIIVLSHRVGHWCMLEVWS